MGHVEGARSLVGHNSGITSMAGRAVGDVVVATETVLAEMP